MIISFKFNMMLWLTFVLFLASFSNAAYPPIQGAKYEHGPYASRVCSLCHEGDDQDKPGKITGNPRTLCLSCHEDMQKLINTSTQSHYPMQGNCTTCHNPHNGDNPNFLQDSPTNICLSCHWMTKNRIDASKVKHGALYDEKGCVNCHNPHGSKIEKLLKALPYDLCVNCHNRDDMMDENGKRLSNIGEIIRSKPALHGPVAAKDCSSCHKPHAADNFRLLIEPYPAKFYSTFDPENYKLCFSCHDPELVKSKATTTLTNFRNGSKNLHFLHVNQSWGRTCRACHEVHAADHKHIVRDSVPYGNGGWQLQINYEPTDKGGRCSKTCHSTKEYVR